VRVLIAILIGCAAIAGCTSPETTRERGEGRGADVGNRPSDVKMHEGSKPFWKTPEHITVEHPPLDSALQAQQLSRP